MAHPIERCVWGDLPQYDIDMAMSFPKVEHKDIPWTKESLPYPRTYDGILPGLNAWPLGGNVLGVPMNFPIRIGPRPRGNGISIQDATYSNRPLPEKCGPPADYDPEKNPPPNEMDAVFKYLNETRDAETIGNIEIAALQQAKLAQVSNPKDQMARAFLFPKSDQPHDEHGDTPAFDQADPTMKGNAFSQKEYCHTLQNQNRFPSILEQLKMESIAPGDLPYDARPLLQKMGMLKAKYSNSKLLGKMEPEPNWIMKGNGKKGYDPSMGDKGNGKKGYDPSMGDKGNGKKGYDPSMGDKGNGKKGYDQSMDGKGGPDQSMGDKGNGKKGFDPTWGGKGKGGPDQSMGDKGKGGPDQSMGDKGKGGPDQSMGDKGNGKKGYDPTWGGKGKGGPDQSTDGKGKGGPDLNLEVGKGGPVTVKVT